MKFSELGKGRVPPGAPKPAKMDKTPEKKPPTARSEPPKPLPPARARKPEPADLFDKESHAVAQRAYGEAIAAMKRLVKNQESGASGDWAGVDAVIGALEDFLLKVKTPLLLLTAKSTASNYLYAHAVNVSILSMHMGTALGWKSEDIRAIGWCGFLNDIGMLKYSDSNETPKQAVPDQYSEVRLHPLESPRLLDYVMEIEMTARRLLADAGRAEMKNIRHASFIIGLCELYESLSHQRAWREAALPAQAVTLIMKRHGHEVPRFLLKIFVERISFYPPGSFLQLDSGEIACVMAINPALPTRPLVEMRFKADLSVLTPPVLVDMAKNPLVHVKRPVDESRLNLRDKRQLLALKVGRWFME